MKLAYKIKITLPCILIFGSVGALIAGTSGGDLNWIRAGIIFGGIVAFFILKRKQSGAS